MEAAGRAQEHLSHLVLSHDEKTLLFVAAHMLSQHFADRMSVRCDLVHKERLEAMPSVIYAAAPSVEPRSPAARLGVLVLEPDGMLVPVCYGIDRRLALGRLDDVVMNRQEAWQRFAGVRLRDLHAVGRALLRRLRVDDSITVLNPSEMLAQAASNRVGTGSRAGWGAPLVAVG